MTRAIFAALAALVTAAFTTVVTPLATAQTRPACVWIDEYTRTLADLHETGEGWTISPTYPTLNGVKGWGVTTDDGVVVSQLVPCDTVGDVVRHEHMHEQQIREFGSIEFAAEILNQGRHPGQVDRLELTADCASMLAGSRYHPYVDQAGGCSDRDLRDARQLLFWRPGA